MSLAHCKAARREAQAAVTLGIHLQHRVYVSDPAPLRSVSSLAPGSARAPAPAVDDRSPSSRGSCGNAASAIRLRDPGACQFRLSSPDSEKTPELVRNNKR